MSNAHLFRRLNLQQDQMIRAAMPRLSASDPVPLPAFAQDRAIGSRWSHGVKFAPLTYTLSEVTHA